MSGTSHTLPPPTGAPTISHAQFAADFTSHLASAIRRANDDEDKQVKLSRRLAGHFMSTTTRAHFALTENTTFSDKQTAQSIRNHFDKMDMQLHFYEFLILPDTELLNLLTFNLASSFSTIPDPSGVPLSKFFEDPSTVKVAAVFYKVNLLLDFYCEVFGNHYSYLRKNISDAVHKRSLTENARVIINQWVQVLRALHAPTPYKSTADLQADIDHHMLVWDCSNLDTCLFTKQCSMYTARLIRNSILAMEQAQQVALSSNSLTTTATPTDSSKKPLGLASSAASSFATGAPPIKKANLKDYTPLQGFCVRYLRDGACPKIAHQRLCQARNTGKGPPLINLKHSPEFVKLPVAQKSSIRASFQTLEGVPCKV